MGDTKAKLGGIDILAGKRILIVDDEPLFAKATGALLESWGVLVRSVGDVRTAVKLLESEETPPDAVLLDYVLPDGNPWPVVVAIARRPASTGIVVVTGHGDLAPGFACSLRADTYLAKPFAPNDLLDAVKKAIAASHERGPRPRSRPTSTVEDRASACRRKLDAALAAAGPRMTRAEHDALRMRIEGLTYEAIGASQGIEPPSARALCRRAARKLAAGNAYELARVIADLLPDPLERDWSTQERGMAWLATLVAAAMQHGPESDESGEVHGLRGTSPLPSTVEAR